MIACPSPGFGCWVSGVGCQVLGVGCWVSGLRCQVSGVRCQVLGVGCWVLGVGCWVLGVGCWVLGVGCWVLGVGCWVLGFRVQGSGFGGVQDSGVGGVQGSGKKVLGGRVLEKRVNRMRMEKDHGYHHLLSFLLSPFSRSRPKAAGVCRLLSSVFSFRIPHSAFKYRASSTVGIWKLFLSRSRCPATFSHPLFTGLPHSCSAAILRVCFLSGGHETLCFLQAGNSPDLIAIARGA